MNAQQKGNDLTVLKFDKDFLLLSLVGLNSRFGANLLHFII